MMKSNTILRLLSGLAFLLLLAPFYDSCTFNKESAITEEPAVAEAPSIGEGIDTTFVKDTISYKKDILVADTITKVIEVPLYQKAYELIDDPENQNIIELAVPVLDFFKKPLEVINEVFKNDSLKKNIEGIAFWIRSFSLAFIIILTTLIFILSFFNKIHFIRKLVVANLVLIAMALICILFFDPLFATYKQIKWGFYIFTMVQIGILYFSKKKFW